MDLFHSFLSAPTDFVMTYVLPFVLVLSVLVFVHELGHYLAARWNGVRVDEFSIGFGKELFGWTDKNKTHWKVSILPFGGYVQMFGDSDPTSSFHRDEKLKPLTAAEKKVAFYTQTVGKRASIVFAGPAINFIFAVLIMTLLFSIQGQPYTPPVVAKLLENSPAAAAGVRVDDKIIMLDDQKIECFEDMVQYVSLHMDKPIKVQLLRYKGNKTWSDKPKTISVSPEILEQEDRFGFKSKRGRLGIVGLTDSFDIKEHTVFSAFVAANVEVWDISKSTLIAIGQMIAGTRSPEELGGILRIGAYAGDFAKAGILSLVMFMALLSVNLGLINFMPIPLLDGGHLMFYAFESVRGKPMNERVQEYALRAGMAFVMSLMLFSTWNDLVQLNVIEYFKKLIS